MKAAEVLQTVRDKLWSGQAFAWLYEVRSKTGASHFNYRYADALVVSLYPSRGIWLAGVEVKVDRGDWLRELADPKKSAEIQSYCDYWWIATPEDVVRKEEIPETWGHLEIRGNKVARAKAAPRAKKPKPMTAEFAASVFRNMSEQQQHLMQGEYHRGYDAAEARFCGEQFVDLQQQLAEAHQEKRRLEQQLQWKTSEAERLTADIKFFEQQTGIEGIGRFRPPTEFVKHFRAAMALSRMNGVEHVLRTALEAYEPVAEVLKTMNEESFKKAGGQ